ncbi:MAG: rRNA pseudouridine synthase [Thermoanaerobaculia bacterium]|nr:rRNA pseudouridine synthase [Thermoanaerobaculia bacterium]
MNRERLQKVLARAGVGSRRKVEEWIREGRITVNGVVAELGTKADLEWDAVKVDDKRIQPLRGPCVYLVLNKPAGHISSRRDPEGRRTVLDLVPVGLHRALVPVGRLDFDTEGLLLLTSDGDFAQRVAHPRYGCAKTYEVKVKGAPVTKDLNKLREGIVLEGHRTAPVEIEPFRGPEGARDPKSNSWFRVVLGEGRTRQIREMFFRIGHPVQRLRRVGIGPLHDPNLPLGQWRHLTDDEVARLRGSTRGGRGSVEQVKRRRATRQETGPGKRSGAGRKRGGDAGKSRRGGGGTPRSSRGGPRRGKTKNPRGRRR